MRHHRTSHHITADYITSHHITSHHITSHHITHTHHITSHPTGERERDLKRAIQARFDVVEPPAVFLKTGNEHLGKKVLRTFGKKRKVQGEVVGWLPAAGDDEALWKVINIKDSIIMYQNNASELPD